MSEKSEALRLANSLDAHSLSRHGQTQAAAELRRLAAVEAQRDALLEALEEIHQATMKNKVVIAKYIGINFLAAIAIRKAKEGEEGKCL